MQRSVAFHPAPSPARISPWCQKFSKHHYTSAASPKGEGRENQEPKPLPPRRPASLCYPHTGHLTPSDSESPLIPLLLPSAVGWMWVSLQIRLADQTGGGSPIAPSGCTTPPVPNSAGRLRPPRWHGQVLPPRAPSPRYAEEPHCPSRRDHSPRLAQHAAVMQYFGERGRRFFFNCPEFSISRSPLDEEKQQITSH